MKGLATNRFPWQSEHARPASRGDLDRCLDEVVAAGFDAVEGHEPDLLAGAAARGLAICGTYVSGPLHQPWDTLDVETAFIGPARAVAWHGADYLAVNADPKGGWSRRERKTEAELRTQGENLVRLSELTEALGLSVVLHNHADQPELHRDDLRSVDEFADETVGLCFDTGWALASQDEPVARVRALEGRVWALHLRNGHGALPTEWLEEGDMDLAALVAVLRAAEYDGWVTTELWHREDVVTTMSLLENQRRSNDRLRGLWV